jgi:N-acyl-D-amino-acid deacylase
LLDVVFEGGRIVDGTGNPWFYGDVGVHDGKIVSIARRVRETAAERIDARGLVVAPGFVDVHAHSDFSLFYDPAIMCKLRQGITTEVTGNCGLSAAPLRDGRLSRMQADICADMEVELKWTTFEEYLECAKAAPLGTNVGWLVGYNTVREWVAGVKPTLTSAEQGLILEVVGRAMEAGALGLSSGLVYEPGNYATVDDLVEVCRVVAGWGGIYSSHTRGLRETLAEGVAEAIEIGRRAEVPVQISHLTPQYGGWDRIQLALDRIDAARAEGVDVCFDLHLDEVGGTSALATLPPWVKEGDVDAMIGRLTDPRMRAQVSAEVREFVGPGTSGFIRHSCWDLLRVASAPGTPDLVGKSFEEIAKVSGKAPIDTYFDIIVANRGKLQLTGLYTPAEEIRRVLAHPRSMVATDAVSPSRTQRVTTPRNYSTMPKLLGRYVREESLLSLEEAVQKITSRPAIRFGLRGRGILAEGFWADVVVFDPVTVGPVVTDEGVMNGEDYPDPYARGILYVAVNGILEIREGRPTGMLAGRPLLRA